MFVILSILLVYVVGSIPFGLVIGKLWTSTDVRQHGSGNIGTSNVMRTVGRIPAIIVLVLDVAKGMVPVLIAQRIGADGWIVGLVAVAAVFGHIFSVFLKFQGGKGIATALGTAVAFDWRIALTLVVVWIGVVAVTRYISVASVTGAAVFPVAAWVYGQPPGIVTAGVILSIVAIYKHRSNMKRVWQGTEYKFGQRLNTGSSKPAGDTPHRGGTLKQ